MDENAIMSLVEEMVLAVFDEVHFSGSSAPRSPFSLVCCSCTSSCIMRDD